MFQEETPPNITLPLPIFLDILWGYKKGAELRERAVPGEDVVNCIKSIPNYEKYVHIQAPKEGCSLSVVWQKQEWKMCGERQELVKHQLQTRYSRADLIAAKLREKFPFIPASVWSGVAHQIEHGGNYAALVPFGITKEWLDKEVPPSPAI